jgi:hypothetical protein
MRYLCLGYQDEKAWELLDPEIRKSLTDQSNEYEEILRRGGRLLESLTVQGSQPPTTLRIENGVISVGTDSAADSKEQLVLLLIIEARDLNLAIQLLSRLPSMQHGGSLEIRPIQERQSS